MKQLKLNDLSISIPESWEEITLKKQLEVERLAFQYPEYKSLAVIAGYCDIAIDQVKKLHINDVKSVLDSLSFISEPIPTSTGLTEFSYKGDTYYLVPTLLKGQFQDFLMIETELQNNKGKEYQSLPVIISVLAKRKDETLNDFNLIDRAKHFEDLPITVANDIWFFFALTTSLYSRDFLDLLNQKDKEILQSINSMKSSLKSSHGGGLLTRWLKGILRIYLDFLLKGWTRFFSGFQSVPLK